MVQNAERRRPGRPAGDGDVRAALLASARRQFAARGYDAVPLHAIAAGAGVNPAMIRYYFGGKAGLYEAVLAAAAEPLRARLERLEGERDLDALVGGLAAAWLEAVARDPWLPPLLVRELLLPGGRLRERLVDGLVARAGGLAGEALARDGAVRADLEPRLAGLALLGLAIFPAVAAPVVREALGIDAAVGERERLIEHLRALFLDGVRAP